MNLKIQNLAGNTLMSRFHVGFEIELPLITYFSRLATADARDKPIVIQSGFYIGPGRESLITMTQTILNTTETVINRFTPKERDCYTDEEFKFERLKYKYGFRYSMPNCLYASVLESIIEHCQCQPNFAFYFNLDLPWCKGKRYTFQKVKFLHST